MDRVANYSQNFWEFCDVIVLDIPLFLNLVLAPWYLKFKKSKKKIKDHRFLFLFHTYLLKEKLSTLG